MQEAEPYRDAFRVKIKIPSLVLWLLASGVKDIVVYSKDMVILGKVKDVEFDPSEMKVTDFIVEFDKEPQKRFLGR